MTEIEQFTVCVEKKNVEKFKRLLNENKDLLTRAYWTKKEAQLI